MKSLLVLILASIFLLPLASKAFAASTQEVTPSAPIKLTRLPFKGTIQSTETYVTVSPTMSVTARSFADATPDPYKSALHVAPRCDPLPRGRVPLLAVAG